MDAITTIRLNSKRVPCKSIKKLNGIPLLNYALQTMNKVKEIDNIIIYASTDLSEYILPSIKYTLKFRSPLLDSDTTTFNEIMDKAINLTDSEYVLFFCVTSPFMKFESINNMIDKVTKDKYDSAFTANDVKKFAWFNNKPLNYNIRKIPRTQDMEPILIETSSLYIFDKESYKKTGRRIGQTPYIQRVGQIEGLDIDYPEDFEIAEYYTKFLSLQN